MVLGWSIRIYRQAGGGAAPAAWDSPAGRSLASWRTGLFGADWLADLVAEGRALSLGGNGYPYTYTARARHIVPYILAVPLDVAGPQDPRTPWIDTRPVIDRAAAEACPPDEWLLIEVWDLD